MRKLKATKLAALSIKLTPRLLTIVIGVLTCCTPATQMKVSAQGRATLLAVADAARSPAHTYFTDVVLVNQFGENMRLYSDLIKGRVVVISSFFGTCQGSCPIVNHNLEQVQQALKAHSGKDLYFISITVDPTVDTPARLNEYAKQYNAKPGWYFLSGEKQNVEFALRKLGQYVEDKQDHLNVIIIGNERTGLWKKAFGLTRSEELVKVVESVLNDQSPDNQ
jgi:protein SCO1